MIKAAIYNVIVVETNSYLVQVADLMAEEEQKLLKEFLAVHPCGGELVAGTGGFRSLIWQVVPGSDEQELQVLYFFRDLNGPVYLIAVFAAEDGNGGEFDDEFKAQLKILADELLLENFRYALAQKL